MMERVGVRLRCGTRGWRETIIIAQKLASIVSHSIHTGSISDRLSVAVGVPNGAVASAEDLRLRLRLGVRWQLPRPASGLLVLGHHRSSAVIASLHP